MCVCCLAHDRQVDSASHVGVSPRSTNRVSKGSSMVVSADACMRCLHPPATIIADPSGLSRVAACKALCAGIQLAGVCLCRVVSRCVCVFWALCHPCWLQDVCCRLLVGGGGCDRQEKLLRRLTRREAPLCGNMRH